MKITKSYIEKIIKEELEAVMAEGSYEDEIMKGEEEMERHMARKAAMKRSRPSSAPAVSSGEYPERPPIDMKALMQSVQDEIRAKGGNVTIKITDKQTGEVTEL